MTPRKIHYWLKTDLLGRAVRPGARGVPTFLSFEQVLKIKSVQRIRDELGFSLPKARKALRWVLDNLILDDAWEDLRFIRSGRAVGVGLPDGSGFIEIGGQGILTVTDEQLHFLTSYLQDLHEAWLTRTLPIEGYSKLHSNAMVMAGSPVIAETRIETAFIANLAREMPPREIHDDLFPEIEIEAIAQAARFEGVEPLAA